MEKIISVRKKYVLNRSNLKQTNPLSQSVRSQSVSYMGAAKWLQPELAIAIVSPAVP